MKATEFPSISEMTDLTAQKSLLVIGPLPPPVGGATVLFKVFVEEARKCASVQLSVINIRSPRTYYKRKFLFGSEALQRAAMILDQYFKEIRHCDAVLAFGNNPFNLSMVPVLLMLARFFNKPFYLHPIGGDLDLFLAEQNKLIQKYLITVLRTMDSILPQTQLLQKRLIELGCENTNYMPDFRPSDQTLPPQINDAGGLRLLFFSQIKREKGPLILLEALCSIAQEEDTKISCDFYGPIFEEVEQEFLAQVEQTPGAKYCGVAEVGTASDIIRTYDALVLPTYFKSEGHPGVIIEAMQAGVPIISTHHRAIPELITDGENGLLVPKQDSPALAEAIKRLALDAPLRQRMGVSSYQKGQEFRADVVVPKVLQVIFPK